MTCKSACVLSCRQTIWPVSLSICLPNSREKLSHSIYECKYHIIFCPKYRYRILKDEIAEYVKQQIYLL
ncbi:MAG: hypothetical protein GY943_20590 [Chloroflexi bacterium]|nr:hypothetical protein [Chloroflexota bacterium]